MKINDRIYGEIEINDPIILALIETKPFQRLKNINQYGAINFVFKESFQVNRYEHSIGVWYATYRLGGNIEEQVAALLHDVGHYAFSHLVDQARHDAREDAHELSSSELDGWNEIEKILKANNLTLKNVDDYPIIKNSLPNVGSDRLDYAIRDLECVIHTGDHFGSIVLENVKFEKDNIIFQDVEVAEEFSIRGNKAMWHVIYDPIAAVIYQSMIEILRDGLVEGWLSMETMLRTDTEVFEVIKKHQENFEKKHFRVFSEMFNVTEVEDKLKADFVHVKLKVRYFDPLVKVGSVTSRVSELSPSAKEALEYYVDIFEKRKEGVGFKLIF